MMEDATGSSRLFHHQAMTKTPDLEKLNSTNTSLNLNIPNTLLKL